MSVILSGALCSTGAASYALTGEIDSAYSVSDCAFAGARYVSPALVCAVLNDDAGSVDRWIGGSVLIEYARAGRR